MVMSWKDNHENFECKLELLLDTKLVKASFNYYMSVYLPSLD